MNNTMPSPFVYGDFRGTSWYRRFAAEEYYIVLDRYPERKIIMDRLVLNNPSLSEDLIKEYYRNIISYFFDSEMYGGRDNKTFLQVLFELRTLRNSILPDLFTKSGYTDSRNYLDSLEDLHPNYRIELRKNLVGRLEGCKHLLFMPGQTGRLNSELNILRSLTKGMIEVVPVSDPLIPGVGIDEVGEIIRRLNTPDIICSLNRAVITGGELSLKEEPGTEALLFTTNIWYYLSVFRNVKEIGFFLENSEWVSRGLFQETWEEGEDHTTGMYPGSYTTMVHRAEPHAGKITGGLQQRQFPNSVDVSGINYTSLGLSGFLDNLEPELFYKSIVRKTCLIKRRCPEIVYESKRYTLGPEDKLKEIPSTEEGVLITSIIVPEQSVTTAPLFFSSCISPEDVPLKGRGFLFSFNYYFTSNLVQFYNEEVPARQKLNYKNIFIDYMGEMTSEGWQETIPLYPKTFIGCTSAGILFAGRYSLIEASLFIDGKELVFTKEKINPKGTPEGLSLHLPASKKDSIGEERNCLVIVQDQVVFIGAGPCKIPPIGCVVVLDGGDRPEVFVPPLAIRWECRFSDLPCKKEELSWLTGGFNMLYQNGQNLYSTTVKGKENLELEGWYSEASEKTQETRLDPSIRQPRMIVGRTISGKLFAASFSGRTVFSLGVTFGESITYAQKLLPDGEEFHFLVNLDGGASASAVYFEDDIRINGSLTATTMVNPTGVPRRLSGYLSLKIKNPE